MNNNLMRFLCKKSNINYLLKYETRSDGLLSRKVMIKPMIRRNYWIDFQSYRYSLFKLSESIANSSLVNSTKDNLISIHDSTHMSWTLELALISVAVRALVTFPLSIGQHKVLARYEALTPEINEFALRLKKEVKDAQYIFNWTPLKAKLMYTYRMKQEVNRLIIRDNCHPFKASLVLWIQMPVWVTLSHCIRNMSFMYPIVNQKSQLVFNQLSNEGILWFNDLSQTDPYLILPFLTAIVNLTIVQIHSNDRLKRMGTKTRFHSVITNLGRLLSLCLIPIGLYMPSSVCFYWFMSSSMGLIQNLILRNNRFKQIIGTDSQLKQQSVKPLNN